MRARHLSFVLALMLAPEAGITAEEEAQAEETAQAVNVDPQIFETALQDFYAESYADAAAGFWGYVRFGEASAENHEWAQFFLAESLSRLGLYHAAVQYYVIVAKTRSRPEILPEALARLEALTRERPYNEDLVDRDLLYDSDFGALPSELGSWINYVQGSYDLRDGNVRWATRHFQSIVKNSPYALKARYVEAVYALKKKQDEKAAELFLGIADSRIDEPLTKNRSNLALARILYDLGQYKEALAAYERVRQINLSFEQAQILVEKAWAAYQLRDMKKALGLLHALEAPSYQRFLVPDAFVLRGVILKELCHFIPAKRVVRAFRARYQRALEQLHDRAPLTRVSVILDGATQEGFISRRTAYIRTLEAERRLIDRFDSEWEDVELEKHLHALYDAELKEEGRRWKLGFESTSAAAANSLLEAEEQIALLDYEVGLDIFKRLKLQQARQAKEEPLIIPYDSANVYYEFDTEFWNDELHSYQYYASNRCFESEEVPQ
jgi:TolA-binding protein